MPSPSLARILALILVTALPSAGAAQGTSLRFYGNGVNDIDRVKIRIDDPANTNPGPPADVGAADFTIEFWMKARASENTAGAVSCGGNINWIYGNIVLDRDRYNQDRKFGLSIAGSRVVFGVSGDGTGDETICSTTGVLDDVWHHVAVARRRSDGWLWLYVDGALEGSTDGPNGDISYPDDGVPGDYCGGPCTNSDPFLVLGAEKHDAGPAYPAYSGWLDDVRLSNALRYSTNFVPLAQPFSPDASTVALYHFDEGSGDAVADASGAPGGPSPGVRKFGGSPAGPEWSPETPFVPTAIIGPGRRDVPDAGPGAHSPQDAPLCLTATPNPFPDRIVVTARIQGPDGGSPPAALAERIAGATLAIHDASGRKVADVAGRPTPQGVEFAWDRTSAPSATSGVYFARLAVAGAIATEKLVARPLR